MEGCMQKDRRSDEQRNWMTERPNADEAVLRCTTGSPCGIVLKVLQVFQVLQVLLIPPSLRHEHFTFTRDKSETAAGSCRTCWSTL